VKKKIGRRAEFDADPANMFWVNLQPEVPKFPFTNAKIVRSSKKPSMPLNNFQDKVVFAKDYVTLLCELTFSNHTIQIEMSGLCCIERIKNKKFSSSITCKRVCTVWNEAN
jgi:hypothetical protein